MVTAVSNSDRPARSAVLNEDALRDFDRLADRAAATAQSPVLASFELPFHPQQGALQGAAPVSFAERVRGATPHPLDYELAQIAAAVYDPKQVQAGRWTRIGDQDLRAAGIDPALLEDAKTGFRAGLYRDAGGDVVLAFAGSNDAHDWLSNFRQGLGFDDAQYDRARDVALLAKAAYGDRLAITGHSLGGGLASAAALAAQTPAVTFNAAGLSDKTIQRLGLDPGAARSQADGGLVRRYAVNGEILTHEQEDAVPQRWLLPDAVGHEIRLNDPHPLSFWQSLVPGAELKHQVDLHLMPSVLDAMRQTAPWH